MVRRRIVPAGLALLAWPARGAAPASESGFAASPAFPPAGPGAARGVLAWVHGTYGPDRDGPPDPPDIVGREAASGLDILCFNRRREADPLAAGAETLARGLRALRAEGYRRVLVAGHSRGAWIALTALAHPGLADGVAAFSPAAHGTRPERKAQALAEWEALWERAAPPSLSGTRVVLAQLADDPWDPDPPRRLTVARARMGDALLSIFQPDAPRGHAGVYEPAFDERFGAEIAGFLR